MRKIVKKYKCGAKLVVEDNGLSVVHIRVKINGSPDVAAQDRGGNHVAGVDELHVQLWAEQLPDLIKIMQKYVNKFEKDGVLGGEPL